MSFLHRFGSSLNPPLHFHVCVTDGVFEKVEPGTEHADTAPTSPQAPLRFHEATALSPRMAEYRSAGIRTCLRPGPEYRNYCRARKYFF